MSDDVVLAAARRSAEMRRALTAANPSVGAQLDQQDGDVRRAFTLLGVNIDDPVQVRAALAGISFAGMVLGSLPACEHTRKVLAVGVEGASNLIAGFIPVPTGDPQ